MVTQIEINDAVLTVKGMQSSLAWELMKEEEYGGDTSCCMFRLGLLWLWRRALSCQVVEKKSTATILIQIGGAPHSATIQIFVNKISISGFVTGSTGSTATAWMQLLVTSINAYQTTYFASFDGTNIILNGGDGSELLVTSSTTWPGVVITTTDFSGYVAANGCLSDAEIKSLIGKINVLCQ